MHQSFHMAPLNNLCIIYQGTCSSCSYYLRYIFILNGEKIETSCSLNSCRIVKRRCESWKHDTIKYESLTTLHQKRRFNKTLDIWRKFSSCVRCYNTPHCSAGWDGSFLIYSRPFNWCLASESIQTNELPTLLSTRKIKHVMRLIPIAFARSAINVGIC